MKLNALFAALFGAYAAPALPTFTPSFSRAGCSTNRRLPRSRIPGPVQPAGSKLARMADEHRVGIRR